VAFLIILTLGSWDSLWFLKGLWFVLEFATHLSHCTLYLVVQSDSNHNSDSLGLTCAGNRPFCRFIPVGVKVATRAKPRSRFAQGHQGRIANRLFR
jgi:hypothetical protein